ncbi:ubiquitin-like-specific protease ESD4 [Andrographis paniculata]|uniref:ubiquitin-like-specific protease ESD4 n=1 Tax=Andrographis paniculata TaxID=175694 RepID=UPI0021E7864F|nr:ubiquitin-like-specific protease ESD4 [Andrographis paniculata]
MGALTNSRKRRDDYFKALALVTPPIPNSRDHVLKKQKVSLAVEQCTPDGGRSASRDSVVSRIARYPDSKTGFSREVHAPVRNTRFRRKSSETLSGCSKESSPGRMGTFSGFSRLYNRMRDAAMRSLRYFDVKKGLSPEKHKEKEVIEIDSDDEEEEERKKPNDLSEDSSIEELEKGDVENVQEPNVEKVEKEVRSLESSLVTDGSGSNVKIKIDDDDEKKGLGQLDEVRDDFEVPSYIRLLEAIKKRRDDKLTSLHFSIELVEKRIQGFHLFRPQTKEEEEIKKDVADECFVPLTEVEKKEISDALSNFNRRKVIVKHENSNIDITGQILQCLRPGAWLNDEVINLYLELLKERERREPQKFLQCHFFNTFFYKKLISGKGGYNYQSVRRWTTQKKLGYTLIECDKIFVPIHKEIHWCLAIINKKEKKFQYLDSLKGNDKQVLNVLARYFVDEVKDKCGKTIDVSSWDKEFVVDLPEQENGYDCGMFMIKYADFYSRDIGLCFNQEHMPYFRQRTVKEILRMKAD